MNIPKSQRKNNPLSMERYAKFLRKKLLFKKFHQEALVKSQSAMEYLMTYGWSILIIAVVLGTLSFLGIFNPLTFAPKATAGGCQVVKNSELGISNLEGSCNNQMPQYVAQFDGQSSYINIPLNFPQSSNITISTWIYLRSIPSGNTGVISAISSLSYGTMSIFPNSDCHIQLGVTTNSWYPSDGNTCLSIGKWYNVIGVADQISHTYDLYINGVSDFGAPETFSGTLESSTAFDVGLFPYQTSYFPGDISNVQIYNTSLTNSSISALYSEGIGGVPIDPQNLVGWWPLNGNANDYSGNQNGGTSANVVFTSNWYNGYSQP